MLEAVWWSFVSRAEVLSWHDWFNVLLCLGGSLVTFGAVNRMSAKETPKTIKVSFVTVGAGLIGAGLSFFVPERWQQPLDTVLYGGILALVIGTRRQTIWIHPEWMPRISAWCSVATWVVFLVMVR